MQTRSGTILCALGACAMAFAIGSGSVFAQSNPVYIHIGHAADAFRSAPDGMGLLPAAVAEAEIAHQHATLAGSDLSSLEGMKRHMDHVINALDADKVENGPGLGMGVATAAEGAARHTELAAA